MKPTLAATLSTAGKQVIRSERYKGVIAETGTVEVTVVVAPGALVMVAVTARPGAVPVMTTSMTMAYIVTK